MGGAITSGGAIKSTATTGYTSTTSGALISAGGLGVAEKAFIGGVLTVADISSSGDIVVSATAFVLVCACLCVFVRICACLCVF